MRGGGEGTPCGIRLLKIASKSGKNVICSLERRKGGGETPVSPVQAQQGGLGRLQIKADQRVRRAPSSKMTQQGTTLNVGREVKGNYYEYSRVNYSATSRQDPCIMEGGLTLQKKGKRRGVAGFAWEGREKREK